MTKTLQLDYPIEAEGRTHTTLTLRRPKVRDQLAAAKASGTDEDKEIQLLANLADLPPSALHELDMADYLKIQEALADFLSPTPEPAGKSS